MRRPCLVCAEWRSPSSMSMSPAGPTVPVATDVQRRRRVASSGFLDLGQVAPHQPPDGTCPTARRRLLRWRKVQFRCREPRRRRLVSAGAVRELPRKLLVATDRHTIATGCPGSVRGVVTADLSETTRLRAEGTNRFIEDAARASATATPL